MTWFDWTIGSIVGISFILALVTYWPNRVRMDAWPFSIEEAIYGEFQDSAFIRWIFALFFLGLMTVGYVILLLSGGPEVWWKQGIIVLIFFTCFVPYVCQILVIVHSDVMMVLDRWIEDHLKAKRGTS
jgi:hypothetical protein